MAALELRARRWLAGGPRAFASRLRARLRRRWRRRISALPDYTGRLARTRFAPFAVPTSEAPDVSIVIPVHDQLAHTVLCLESIAACARERAFEVIVVDDASHDGTRSLEALAGGVRVLRNPENVGFVDSCNRGAAAARGRWLVFLNNDTAVQPGWLGALLGPLERDAGVGLSGGRLLYPDGRLQEAGGLIWSDGSGWNVGRLDHPERPEYRAPRRVDYVSGACLAIARERFEALGGFDPLYRPGYYEDTDLAFRVREAGAEVVYAPGCRVVHFEGASAGRDLGEGMKRHQVVNREHFVARWRDVLASHPPAPPASHAGRAAYHRHPVHVLVLDARLPEADHDSGALRMTRILELLVEEGCSVALLPVNAALRTPAVERLEAIGVEVFTGEWAGSLREHLAERGALYDMVIASRLDVAASRLESVRQACPGARVVFDTVDLHFVREERGDALAGRRGAASGRRRRLELETVTAADVALVVSAEEQRLLARECPGADVRLLSNVHELVADPPGFAARADVGFIGSFEHLPNDDAIRWYLEEIHPRVHAQAPEHRFRVIGTEAPEWLRRWDAPGVEVLGYVEDLDAVMRELRVTVAPLRYGAGVKGKINTSQSHGVPVVSTTIGVEGMALRDGEDVRVADEPQAFADGVVRLLRDEALWKRLSAGSRENLDRHFSRERARETLRGLLADLRRPAPTTQRAEGAQKTDPA